MVRYSSPFPVRFVPMFVLCNTQDILSLIHLQRSLIKQAVVKDSEGKLSLAVALYCEALEHFLPALECM